MPDQPPGGIAGRSKRIASDNGWLVFDPAELTLRRVSADGTRAESITAEPLWEIIRPRICGPPESFSATDTADPRPILARLTLCVTNACNLQCSYCYAHGGRYYGKQGEVMDDATALSALNWASRAYSRIAHISFFGGEPTLNAPVIGLVCEYARFLHRKRVLDLLPSFGVTTNGYALRREVLDLITGQGILVTVSLDGPRAVHDKNRPAMDGGSSFDMIAANIDRLNQAGVALEFECTYTPDHLRSGITIVDLMDFFHERFGCRTLHCPVVSVRPEHPAFLPLPICAELQGEAVDYSIENLSRGVPKAVSTAVRYLGALSTRTPIRTYCPAATAEVTVNADGRVFACFMLMKGESASMGTVNHGAERQVPGPLIGSLDKYRNAACRACWAQPLCHGCLGEDVARLEGRVVRSTENGVAPACDYSRRLVERFLGGVGRVCGGLRSNSLL